MTDLSTDTGGTFSVSDLNGSHAAADLHLGTPSAGTINSGRLIGGLRSALLSGLDGGSGLNDLGLLNLTDRSGASATVDLSC